jgi:lysine-specific demethylase 8
MTDTFEMPESHDKLLKFCLATTNQILEEYSASKGLSTEDSKSCIGPALADLVARQARALKALHHQQVKQHGFSSSKEAVFSDGLLEKRLDDLLGFAEERFELIKYELVPCWWRQLYTDARILMFHLGVLRSRLLISPGHDYDAANLGYMSERVDRLVFFLDMALIKAGGGPQRGKACCNQALDLLEKAWEAYKATDGGFAEPERKRPRLDNSPSATWDNFPSFSEEIHFQPPVTHPIERLSGISLDAWEAFLDPERNPDGLHPVILTDLMTEWPAMGERPWCKPAYLLSGTFEGRRYVPVEIGRSYLDHGWTQKLVPFRDFLREYIDPSILPTHPGHTQSSSKKAQAATHSSKEQQLTGYLAQHDLLSQIPHLRNDILLHDYLWTDPPLHPNPSTNKPKLPVPDLNVWFGPRGTITPLHTDAMHNLLGQVVGKKYIRLYPPSATEAVCPMGLTPEGISMENNSRVDVGIEEGWDVKGDENGWEGGELTEEEKKRFKEAKYIDCVLEAGETLYIPIGWWHYVRSLSVSFSVSFWWN